MRKGAREGPRDMITPGDFVPATVTLSESLSRV